MNPAYRVNPQDLCSMLPRRGWTAKWIWATSSPEQTWRNSYVLFRRRFRSSRLLEVDIAAETRYDLFLDGRRVARGTAPSVAAYKAFDTHRMVVSPGEHVLAVMVHYIGEECAVAQIAHPGLFVEFAGEHGERIPSDANWKCIPCEAFEQNLPVMMSHFGFYEVCDYRRVPEDWAEMIFDDSDWLDADVVGEAGCRPWTWLIPRDIPLLQASTIQASRILCLGGFAPVSAGRQQVSGTVAAEVVSRDRSVYPVQFPTYPVNLGMEQGEFLVVDFGREVTGHVRIRLDNARDGQQLDIAYDEILDNRGLPNPQRTYVEFADRFYLSLGQCEIEVFDARGFRYLMIDVHPGSGGLTINGVELDERTYPFDSKGSFACSDMALNHLYEVGLETTRLCMLDTYVDCPSRERVLWMDSYLEGIFSTYGMGTTDLWRRVLHLYAQDRSWSGDTAGAVKAFVPTDREAILQTYMLYYVCSLSDYVFHSADFETGARLFDVAEDQIRVLERFALNSGLLGKEWPSWPGFLDWSAMDYGGISAGTNAIYIVALRKLARLAGQLGMDRRSRELTTKRKHLSEIFKSTFWSSEDKLFIDAVYSDQPSAVRSQVSNLLAIWAGVVSEKQAREILGLITDKDRILPTTPGDYRLKPDFRPQTGGIVPIGTPALGTLMMKIMFDLGMSFQGAEYLRQHWHGLDVNGTFAEHYHQDVNTSMCHGWSAAPVYILPRYVLGVRPLSPGWENIQVLPHTCGLGWANGTVLTSRGAVEVSWVMRGEQLDLKVNAPKGITIAQGALPAQ